MIEARLARDVPLAPRTTLGLGGPAAYLLRAERREHVLEGLRWARERGLEARILGGGSNLVVADEGFDGLVIEMATEHATFDEEGGVEVDAGYDWDRLVARTVAQRWAGLECLSGIPGRVGAAPIQNVGAYGQEVSGVLERVDVLEVESGELSSLSRKQCVLRYRDSVFKDHPGRWIVLGVRLQLTPGGAPTVSYRELAHAVGEAPSVAQVRQTVLTLRDKKSMLLSETDENRRSAGSFFTNPIVSRALAERVVERALEGGVVEREDQVPRWHHPTAADPDAVKLAAGWLIERAGIDKGTRRGAVGISSKHALALVHHGGGSTAELVELARWVRDTVRARWHVELTVEPRTWGVRI